MQNLKRKGKRWYLPRDYKLEKAMTKSGKAIVSLGYRWRKSSAAPRHYDKTTPATETIREDSKATVLCDERYMNWASPLLAGD